MKRVFKKVLPFFLVFLLASDNAGGATSAEIVSAIQANPSLLDSPQAKAMMQKAQNNSTLVTKDPKATKQQDHNITNNIDLNISHPKEIKTELTAVEQNDTEIINTLFKSPLSIQNNSTYAKRLLANQIMAKKSPLNRYGFEFFANKNGMDLSSLPVPQNYRLVPKDVVSVILYGPKTDNMSLTIDKDGNIMIPSFGPLRISGLSFSEAKKVITDALMSAFPNVGVTVNVSEFSTIQVTIAGEVAIPGLYNLSSFSTVKEALIAAGGLSANGSMREVIIKHNGKVVSRVDLYKIIRGTSNKYNYLLKAGDVIVVPLIGKSITIDGDVKRPAIYEAKRGEMLSDLLFYAGGISASANKNDIRITRYDNNEKVSITTVSLAKARLKNLVDQDKVYVYGIDKSNLKGVTLFGNIVKPGFWQLAKEGMNVGDFFKQEIAQNTLRGVFLEQTYFDYAIIKRTTRYLKDEIIGFSLIQALNNKIKIPLYSRDELYILNSSMVESAPTVKISGECIAKQGEFRYFNKMTLETLLATAGTLCPIDRTKVTIVSPNTQHSVMNLRIINMEIDKSVTLNAFDEIRTVSYLLTNPIKDVNINGEVYSPGNFPIAEGKTTLKELILSAGGLTDKASLSKIEIVRFNVKDGIRERSVLSFTVQQAMSSTSPLLKAYDEITIFKIPQWNERKSVKLFGKVKYPGEYAIEDGDHLSDLIQRAGGFIESAYTKAAVFTREELKVRQQEGVERQIKDLEQRIMFIATQPTEAGQVASDKTQLVSLIGTLKEEIKTTPFVGRLALNIDQNVTKFKGSSSDILLKNGDALYIPEKEDSVIVQGEVLNPNAIVYNPDYGVDEYLEKSGGTKTSAALDSIFIVHANGEAEVAKKGFFFTKTADIGPGDVVVVPMYISTISGMQFAKDITSIVYQLAVSVAALRTIGIF